MSETVIIKVEGLVAAYGDEPILDSVSLEVRRGEIFVILGGSGCGKSTLLKHMIGLYTPVAGRILIHDRDLALAGEAERKTILRGIGVTYQSGALFGSLTLLENVMLPLEELTDLPLDAAAALGRLKLGLVGLADFCDHLPSAVSGGMQKRTALARAMALDPDILFLDEPSAGLDPVTSAGLDALILQLARGLGLTFVIVTHELASIFAIADRVIMLDARAKGIVAEGEPHFLRDNSENPLVRGFFNRVPAGQEKNTLAHTPEEV